ncbi:MAG: hypothetical protein IJW64_02860 [Clostridia bacterium]|nr:hypothetical protein [Clostridia bacterium]
MRKIKKTLIACLLALFAVTIGFGFSTMQSNNTAKAETPTYVTKDVAFLGRVAGWHGNGNFEITITLGEVDWARTDAGEKSFNTDLYGTDLAGVLKSLDFFNKIKLGEKTLAEWGCSACYANSYWINAGEPLHTLRIPLRMSEEDMTTASAAGVGHAYPITVLEGALIPSYGYLQGTSTTVFRAGCEFVSSTSTVAYGIMSVGKTDVESVKYVQGHDGSAGYFGVSLKGDDYAGDTLEVNQNYEDPVFNTTRYEKNIQINGTVGSVEEYGLFGLGTKGQGYFAFCNRVAEENMQSITIPAGTTFPSRAMAPLWATYGNPVYIFYQTQTDVTFYKTSAGEWVKLDEFKATAKAEIDSYRAGKADADYFTADVTVMDTAVSTAKTAIDSAENVATVEGAVTAAKSAIDQVTPKADVINPAKEEVANYKAGLFRQVEEAQRLVIVENAQGLLDEATASDAVSTIVANAKEAIDALKTAAQYADEELAQAKADAKSEISNYLDKANYYEEQHQAIDDAIAGGHEGVNNAADETAINQAVVDAQAVLDEIATKEEVVASLESDLNSYKADADLFRAEQKASRDSIVATAIEAIDASKTYEENSALVADAKEDIDALKTDAELTAEELAVAKSDAKADLDAYKADADLYRDEQATERATIITEANADIDEATEESEIATIVANAKEAIDALKTDAELDAEEALASAKEAGLAQINQKKASLDLTLYTDENVEVINGHYNDAKTAIENATTEEEINTAVSAFNTAVDAVPTVSADPQDSNTGSGCGGNVNGASGVFALLTLCSVVFVARKRK